MSNYDRETVAKFKTNREGVVLLKYDYIIYFILSQIDIRGTSIHVLFDLGRE